MELDDFIKQTPDPKVFDCVICQNPGQLAQSRVPLGVKALALGALGVAGVAARAGYRRWRRSKDPSPPLEDTPS
ncbi:hypothetical protein [Cystobacter ferrugineus]|uniref:Uncharacterized protein n=1 Tax=Cystobacter ferrugineus TaxID=83449 RepID=A0A1L9BAE5_9BACT|nr:hypothetical protein [Cystobacter ferrugineus]OJH39215.1 hypothetical protein BON30_16925 [Cystobacter ferrugineus]